MKIKRALAGAVVATVLLSGAAYAWTVIEETETTASIRCGDGSSASVSKNADGSWTASRAGNNGQTGGRFAILGQAALRACGEG